MTAASELLIGLMFAAAVPMTGPYVMTVKAFAVLDREPMPSAFARLGYVAPRARTPLTQPVLDRYASDIKQRLSQALAMPIVSLPMMGGQPLADASVCRQLRLSGFLAPHTNWYVSADSVTATETLVIRDCNGNMFYENDSSQSEKRNMQTVPQMQVDALEAKISSELLQNFLVYIRLHGSTWNLLLRTGSINGVTPYAKELRSFRSSSAFEVTARRRHGDDGIEGEAAKTRHPLAA